MNEHESGKDQGEAMDQWNRLIPIIRQSVWPPDYQTWQVVMRPFHLRHLVSQLEKTKTLDPKEAREILKVLTDRSGLELELELKTDELENSHKILDIKTANIIRRLKGSAVSVLGAYPNILINAHNKMVEQAAFWYGHEHLENEPKVSPMSHDEEYLPNETKKEEKEPDPRAALRFYYQNLASQEDRNTLLKLVPSLAEDIQNESDDTDELRSKFDELTTPNLDAPKTERWEPVSVIEFSITIPYSEEIDGNATLSQLLEMSEMEAKDRIRYALDGIGEDLRILHTTVGGRLVED